MIPPDQIRQQTLFGDGTTFRHIFIEEVREFSRLTHTPTSSRNGSPFPASIHAGRTG